MNLHCNGINGIKKINRQEGVIAKMMRKQGYKIYYIKTSTRYYPVWARTEKTARKKFHIIPMRGEILEVLEEGDIALEGFIK